jgi:hypothetical protein
MSTIKVHSRMEEVKVNNIVSLLIGAIVIVVLVILLLQLL